MKNFVILIKKNILCIGSPCLFLYTLLENTSSKASAEKPKINTSCKHFCIFA